MREHETGAPECPFQSDSDGTNTILQAHRRGKTAPQEISPNLKAQPWREAGFANIFHPPAKVQNPEKHLISSQSFHLSEKIHIDDYPAMTGGFDTIN
ncbi:hypothetical protein [Microbulbifer litoralis]|uniref:hypothetical protein n=1 Tax=Microbulbifer litoralis TaxID=2933965 RepID=UPI00202941BE|nr:hypothetical protein [Microbulbifer sp. GX H0434]